MKGLSFSAYVLIVCLFCATGLRAQQPDSASSDTQTSAGWASSVKVPRLVRFSGVLRDLAGQPLTGALDAHFAIYKEEADTSAIWEETQTLQLDEHGRYTVLLGATQAEGLPVELFTSGEARWLGVAAGELPEQPRVLLVSVPYALKAGDAETLGGKPAAAYQLAGTNTSLGGVAVVGSTAATPSPNSTAQVTPAATGTKPAATGTKAVTTAGGTIGYLPLWDSSSDITKSVLFENTSTGNIGLGTTTPATSLDINAKNAGLRLWGTGTHEVTVTGATSGRLGQDAGGFFFASDTNGSNVRFLTNNGKLNEWMRLTSAGKVGIGTTTPAHVLDVVGDINASTNITAGGNLSVTGTISGNGSGLTNLTAANLSAGTAGINITGSAATATTATNAANSVDLGGVAAGNYARLDIGNSFTGNQSVTGNVSATGSVSGATGNFTGLLSGTTAAFSGALTAAGAVLPATGTATSSGGFNSNPFDTVASSYNSSSSAAVPQLFRWQAEPAGNNTASPSGTLNLLYLSGSGTPAETGLSIASNGQMTFASGQSFPGTGTVTSVGSGAGLTGGPITSSGTLSIATGGVTNAMLANSSLTVTAGTDLAGGGPAALGSSVTLNLDTTKVPTLGAGSNTFTGNLTASSFTGSSATFAGSTSPVVSVTQSGSGTALTASGGTSGTGVLATSSSSATGATALNAFEGATTGQVYGANGATNSTTGGSVGVIGVEGAATGQVYGVWGTANSTTNGATGVYGYEGATTGMVYGVGATTNSTTDGAAGVNGYEGATTGMVYGVWGTANSTTNGATGVFGAEGGATGYVSGVWGVASSSTSGAAGVIGVENATSGYVFGVAGGTSSTTAGAAGLGGWENATTGQVYGVNGMTSSTTTGAAGVNGYEGATTGQVYGVSGATSSTTIGAAGVYGYNNANGSYGGLGTTDLSGIPTGVFGTSTYIGVSGSGGTGVEGDSPSTGGYGVIGSGSGSSGTGVFGTSSSYYGVYGYGAYGVVGDGSNIGVYGYEGNGGSYGVYSNGDMGASGKKPAVVALPDNRVVELYAMESPENWFEDFGSSELREGVAQVTLDPTFALAANTETGYHVFLTPNGDCEGLYVAQKTATGFQVRELRGGKSNIAFDYRIVAKRRGYESVRMDELETDAETVQRIREVVQGRPAHRKLILHKPSEPLKAPAAPPKVQAPSAAPAVVIPKPPEPPKLPAPPKVAAPPAAPATVTPKPEEPAKAGTVPTTRTAVTAKPREPAKPAEQSEPPQK